MRHSILIRFMLMGAVVFGLGIPLIYINYLVYVRSSRRDGAVRDIGAAWGGTQALYGPMVAVPFRCPADAKVPQCSGKMFAQAKRLEIKGDIQPEIRRRSLFEAVVYTARLNVSATFSFNPGDQQISADRMVWQDATLGLGISHPRGVTGSPEATSGNLVARFDPGAEGEMFPTGIHAKVGAAPPTPGTDRTYTFDLVLHGTRELMFAAVGDAATISLSSPWPDAAFTGTALPDERTTNANGFSAKWNIGAFRRQLSATGIIRATESGAAVAGPLSTGHFGVTLATPVDVYQQTDRAVKYAVLFIVFTFAAAFLWEITRGLFVHPVQYVFIGFALCIFYLLLLSIAEHAGFDRAYALATVAIVGLLAWYWRWIAGAWRQGAGMGGIIAGLYGFLFLLLRLEDHALLAGSVALFLALVAVMALTRRLDWSRGTTEAHNVQRN